MKNLIKPHFVTLFLIVTSSLISYALLKHSDSSNLATIGSIEGYDLRNPDARFELPEILQEISGLTDVDHKTIACVQDEDGIVFIYDLQEAKIKHQFTFAQAGDYEGITRVKNSLYILRSDGKLFEVVDYTSQDLEVNEYNTEISIKDNEGLGYDLVHHRLLIAGKSKPKEDTYKDSRVVFAFDLVSKKLGSEPVYQFELNELEGFVGSDRTATKKFGRLKIHPSAIAVHPLTRQLFVLSSKDHLIYVFSAEGDEVHAIHQLDKKVFNQAEGITFLENSDLLISNEGGGGKSTLLHFAFKK